MKKFAITPDNITVTDVIKHLPGLKEVGVSFLYLRSQLFAKHLDTLARHIKDAGILPVIPFNLHNSCKAKPFGIHFKSHEIGYIQKYKKSSYSCISASCHDLSAAAKMLEESVDYVFVSPVFNPLSKPYDKRAPLSRSSLKELVTAYEERVVLLGGLTSKRIQVLKKDLEKDFSVAGITMFFSQEQIL
jgi:thiamine monophosphate synthase